MGAIASLFGFANAFSPVAVFGTVVPKDGGVSIVADVAYGDDPRQTLDIYRPEGDASDLPVIYFGYGGGWESGDKSDYGFVGRAFAARGYVTVIADYRLVPNVVYPAFVQDNADAIKWVQDAIGPYGGDASRLFLMGHSAGAYNVMMAALDPSYGVEDISAIVGISGPYDFYPFDVSQSRNAFGSYASPEATQPINLDLGGAPPVLLMHGEKDATVYLRNATALSQSLTEAGASVALKIYPRANHADTLTSLSMPLRWRFPVLDDALAFLTDHGGVAQASAF